MKKLWKVRVEFELLVYAESQDDAEDEAEHSVKYGMDDPTYNAGDEITSWAMVPEDWRDAIPYGEETDRTVGQIWEEHMGKVPESTQAELEAAGQERLF